MSFLERAPQRIVDDESSIPLRLVESDSDRGLLTYRTESGDVAVKLQPWMVVKEFLIEQKRPTIEPVKQGKYECAAAALALLLGHSLFQVKRVMGSHGWCNDDRGAGQKLMSLTARDFGRDLISLNRASVNHIGSKLPDAELGVRSVNVADMGHALTWINGEIVDPNMDKPGRKWWGAEWAPWTIRPFSALVLVSEPIPDAVHREIHRLQKEKEYARVEEMVLGLAA